MKDYLKEIHESKTKKELVISYLKYIWAAVKKNYLLVIMYSVILIQFIIILVLSCKLRKSKNNNDDPDLQDKTILKVEQEDKKETLPEQNIQESVKIEPPKVELLDEPVVEEHIGRKGSL